MSYPSQEQAFAAALVSSEPGDEITVHEPWCKNCTCIPVTFLIGEDGMPFYITAPEYPRIEPAPA